MRRMKKKHWSFLAVLIVSVILLTAGCGSQAGSTAQQASEDTSEAATAGNTEENTAVTEEVKITKENAVVGICFARSETGDNEYLFHALPDELVRQGFTSGNIMSQDLTGNSDKQKEEIDRCLSEGCSLLVVAAVDDEDIPEIVDKAAASGAGLVFVNCTPEEKELRRWTEQNINAVWIGSDYAQELGIQMSILYDYSGTDRGLDFNEDGHVGAILIGGGEQALSALEETVHDLGSEVQILGETDEEDPEEISLYTQEILNTHKKEAELILCSTESAALAASDGVQLRHRLVGRDILIIGNGTHEDTCTAIINKLMSGSTFVDFYEQAKLIAVAAKDMIEGNQQKKTIADVIFKVTEENAQEVLDQLWKTRGDKEQGGSAAKDSTSSEEEAADPDGDNADSDEAGTSSAATTRR